MNRHMYRIWDEAIQKYRIFRIVYHEGLKRLIVKFKGAN